LLCLSFDDLKSPDEKIRASYRQSAEESAFVIGGNGLIGASWRWAF